MRIADSLVEQLLTQHDRISQEQLAALREGPANTARPLQDLVISNNILSEEELTKLYASELELPFVQLNGRSIHPAVLHELPERIARTHNVIVFDIDDADTRHVAMADPHNEAALNFLKKQLGDNVRVYVTTDSLLQRALDGYRTHAAQRALHTLPLTYASKAAASTATPHERANDPRVTETVNLIVEYGIRAGASDIHLEPRGDHIAVRYRIDGLLRESNKLPIAALPILVDHLKLLANLHLHEQGGPQEGQLRVQHDGQVYLLSVSILPIVHGEKVVIRIHEESSKPIDLAALGLWGDALAHVHNAILQPHGLITVSGLSNVGVAFTMFNMVSILSVPNVNIASIEDPVRFRIHGANQTQVSPQNGVTFANGLRAILSQDPNVIMVGSLHDRDTTEMSVEAASSGHLVFTGLHAGSAVHAVSRLLASGIEPFLVASSLRVSVSERLARRLCHHCRVAYKPDTKTLKAVEKTFQLSAYGGIKGLHQFEAAAIKAGVGSVAPSTKTTTLLTLYKASEHGCEHCGQSGYSGRIGLFEVLTNTTELQKLIAAKASNDTLTAAAQKSGMLPLQLDGLIKVLRGETSLEEVLRVTA